jgi:hypothetical protein
MDCRALSLIVVLGSLVALQGCAAVGITGAAAGVAMVQGGTGAIVRAGTEYKSGGVIYRTFALPVEDVHAATLSTLSQLEATLRTDELTDEGMKVVAAAAARKIEIRFERLTPVMTRLRLVVKNGLFSRDASTASEILAQTERTIDATTTSRIRPPDDTGPPSASPSATRRR